MIQFIFLVNGKTLETLSNLTYDENGILYSEGKVSYFIPYTSILYIQTGLKKAR